MAGPVPQAWTNLNAALHEATVADTQMSDQQASDAMRDGATQRFVHATDAIFANLQSLRADGTLGRIAAFLSK